MTLHLIEPFSINLATLRKQQLSFTSVYVLEHSTVYSNYLQTRKIKVTFDYCRSTSELNSEDETKHRNVFPIVCKHNITVGSWNFQNRRKIHEHETSGYDIWSKIIILFVYIYPSHQKI